MVKGIQLEGFEQEEEEEVIKTDYEKPDLYDEFEREESEKL